MNSYNAYDIAKYIIWKHRENEITITNLCLQKLLYYVQGYFLKTLDKPAFCEDISHWAYGPVVVDVYYEYCAYGSTQLPCPDDVEYDRIERLIDTSDRRVIDRVLKATNKLLVSALIDLTHGETPWKETKNKEIISIRSIKNYFEENDPLNFYLGFKNA